MISRADWIGVLSRALPADLERMAAPLVADVAYELLRPAETGLAMVRGRAGGTGSVFNLGEMTLTRCSVRLDHGVVGHGFAQGRSRRQAEYAAVLDALLQDESIRDRLAGQVIAPLQALEAERRELRSRKAAATKVEFFTMVRGENAR